MYNQQRTVSKSISCSGVGMHSGKKVTLTIKPAPANHGIKFIRTDLPDSPGIAAHFNMVVDTSLATVIGQNGFIVSTIEHIMAAFAGLEIDNAIVELNEYEVPIMDGSAGPFIELIKSVGIKTLASPKYFFIIREPIVLNDKDSDRSVSISPSTSLKISCAIDFNHPVINKQSYSFEVSDRTFSEDISQARTFGFMHEFEYLQRYGFAKGGSLDNAVVIDKNNIINKNGLRYKDEFVRHKILDSMGDFALLGMPILGHINMNKSGHAFNHAFIKEFFTRKESWETGTLSNNETNDNCEQNAVSC